MPWTDDPSFVTKDPASEVMAGAGSPSILTSPAACTSRSSLQKSVTDKIFVNQRGWIYLEELWETAALLVVLWVVAGMS